MAETGQAIWATGRRKTSVARVRMYAGGDGSIRVNERELREYFPRETSQMVVAQAFEATETTGQFRVLARVHGGGAAAQAEALRLGIARALLEVDPSHRGALKKSGLLTRDAREVERKKYGRHKARKRPQFSKR